MDIKNRVQGLEQKTAEELQDNKGNWRTHPQFQRDALKGVKDEVGIADALKAYYSKRNGGKLTLVDGHLRKGDYPDLEWPVLILDITDEEADILLASFDPIAALAEANHQKRLELTDGLEAKSKELKGFLETMDEESRIEVDIQSEMTRDLDGESMRKLGDRKKQIKPVLYVDDLSTFERAILATGNINRGEAIIEICEHYLDEKG